MMPGRGLRKLLIIICSTALFLTILRARYKSKQTLEDWEDYEAPLVNQNRNQVKVDKQGPLNPIFYPQHRRLQNGLVETNLNGIHPIADLIERGERTWKNRIKRQSKTLQQAVKEYKRRYDRPPPRGFDKWWKWAKEHNFILVDEFDQINQNIEPFFALSPKIFQQRVEDLAHNLPFQFSITIKDGVLLRGGERATLSRAQDMYQLVEPFAHLLPNLAMYASDHDKGNIILGSDQYDRAIELASEGAYLDTNELDHFENLNRNHQPKLLSACAPYSNAVRSSPPETNSSHIFLAEPLQDMNYCHDPSLKELHGTWAFDHAHQSLLTPMWVHCKWIQDPSFLMPALPGHEDIIRDPSKIIPWSQRRDTRLFWRARSTGVDFHTGKDWRLAHRVRLHFFGANKTGDVELLQEGGDESDDGADDIASHRDYETERMTGTGMHGSLWLATYSRAEVVEKYLDVGLVNPLVQCNEPPPLCDKIAEEIGFLPPVDQSRGQDVKYVADIDGNGWSQRYGRLLSTGSVVLKSTVFPEWNTNWLVPWYHYVPLKVDYSDLFDIMAFFSGWPDGTPGHDNLGEKIAMNGVKFTRDHWRWEDMQVYMFRLLLEYARLASSDREAASYLG